MATWMAAVVLAVTLASPVRSTTLVGAACRDHAVLAADTLQVRDGVGRVRVHKLDCLDGRIVAVAGLAYMRGFDALESAGRAFRDHGSSSDALVPAFLGPVVADDLRRAVRLLVAEFGMRGVAVMRTHVPTQLVIIGMERDGVAYTTVSIEVLEIEGGKAWDVAVTEGEIERPHRMREITLGHRDAIHAIPARGRLWRADAWETVAAGFIALEAEAVPDSVGLPVEALCIDRSGCRWLTRGQWNDK